MVIVSLIGSFFNAKIKILLIVLGVNIRPAKTLFLPLDIPKSIIIHRFHFLYKIKC